MTTSAQSACQVRNCKHYITQVGPLEYPIYVCSAFPKGIPAEIAEGRNDHSEPFKGDGGIRYSPAKFRVRA
jgi:hypothetical protein